MQDPEKAVLFVTSCLQFDNKLKVKLHRFIFDWLCGSLPT